MSKTLPRGTYVPIVTPFTKQRNLDLASLDGLIDRMLDAKVEAILVLGTTGESPTLTSQEYSTLIEHTVARVGGAAAVVAGVGCNNTLASLRQAETAAKLGVDGLLVVCPYYNKPSQRGLYEHFHLIAEEVNVPQLVYNIAGRTGVNIETDTLARLAELPNIVGVKESSDSVDQISEVLQQLPNDFLVLSGCDHLNFALLCLGGHGVISTVANLVPGKVKAMVDAMCKNDISTARNLHYELQPLVEGCSVETNPIPAKTALALMGQVQEVFRAPMSTMQPDYRNQWCSTLQQHGLIQM